MELQALVLVSRRDLEKFLGLLNFAAKYVPLGRLYLLPLIRWMNLHSSTSCRDALIPLSKEFKLLLAPWRDPEFLALPVPMNPPIPSVEIMTDASLFGWSMVLLPHRVEGAWDQGVWHHSMNWKELKAIHLTLIHFSHHLSGKSVRVLSDNRTALACLRNHGSLASQALLD